MRSYSFVPLLLALSIASAQAASPSAEERIDLLVQQLDDDVYQVREAAHQELVEIGSSSIPAVRKATTSKSAEVRFRSEKILRQILSAGRVLYLPMDRHPRAVTRVHNAKLTQDREGNDNQATSFDGAGFVTVADVETPDTDDKFTLAAWIKPREFVAVQLAESMPDEEQPAYPWGQEMARWDGHYIVAKWFSEAIHGDYLFAVTPSGQLGLGVSDYESGYRWDALQTRQSLKAGEWVHVAATFDGGDMKLYVNGKLAAEKKSAKVTQTSIQEYDKDDIYVGALWNNRYNFRGSVDELCIYSRSLSQHEIDALMMVTK